LITFEAVAMPLEHTVRVVERAGRPVLLAIAVVGVILVAATAYTFAGAQPGPDDRPGQAVSLRPTLHATVGAAVAER
jgi:hypothetical protein